MNDLISLLRQFRNRRVLVVGDGGHDHWHEMKRGRDFEDGRPTYEHVRTTSNYGMASFVGRQCALMGAHAYPIVSEHCSHVRYVCDDGATFGIRECQASYIAADMAGRAVAHLPSYNAVILSDYGKGVCTPEVCRAIIDAANEHKIPVLVDPARGADWAKYAGATVIKASLEDGSGGPEAFPPIEVTTRGKDGIQLRDAVTIHRIPAHIPAGPHIDTIGCGDICAAVLGLTLAVGAPLLDGCRLAAVVAGMKTQYRGCRAITAEEVERELSAQTKAATG